MALPDDWETHPRVWPDRDTVIQRACDSLQARKHVIVAGDILLDRRTIISDIVSRLRDVGVAVLDTSASETVTSPVSPDTVVVVDLGIMTPELEQWCTTLIARRGATVLVATPSADPPSTSVTLAQRLRAAQADELFLAPLTTDEAHAIVDDVARQHAMTLTPVEANWMVAICAGSAPLLRALVDDYAESDESSVAAFGRHSRAVANEALTEIPAALLPTARLVASLPGIGRRRLRRFVDGHALDLLTETAIATRADDTIVINQAIVLALHLTTPPHLDNAAILVANDVMTSLALGTTCTEAEVLLASTMLREHPHEFADVPWVDRSRLLFTTMWLQRRAGATDHAAFAARQLMSQPGWEDVSVLRSIARGLNEDLEALSADIRAASFPPEAYDLTLPWVQCLSLPLTRDSEATRWAMDLTDGPIASPADAAVITALRTVMRAARALQEQDLSLARTLVTDVLLPEGAHDATRLRGIIILGAAASLDADGPNIARFVNHVLGITLSHSEPGLTHDLARRGLDDALLLCALTLASVGAPTPPGLFAAIDQRTHAAAATEDHPALIRMAITRLMTERDEANTTGTMRFLRHLNRTDLSAWVLGRFGGDPAEPPLYLVSGTFMEHALSSSRLLSTLATRGPEGLAARWSTYPTAGTPFRTICEAYLDLTVHKTTPNIDAATIAGLDLPEGSILAAVRDHAVGLLQNDPTTLTKALHAFIATHAWGCARVVNRDLATVTADDPSWAKKVKAGQRLLQSEMRSVAAAQASLTPRERQIMRLASQGLRNKQIAEELYVSVRTVESHLYRALHKLSAVREELTDGVEASSS
ncbi:helix-turn-helix transcriptional regulator [Microbacterium sp. YY-03]|uniref:helix-turn-helix transcriptional regulator n=1 Tax=Microbacterium sp. YY-03 TaxID=3421636 RepID=UPI003D180747